MEAGRGGCQAVMMTVTSNEKGGAYRWADEVEWRGGCPALTASWRGKTQQEPTPVVCGEEQEEEWEHPQKPD